MKLEVLDLTGKKVGNVELADSVFQCEVNNQAIFDLQGRRVENPAQHGIYIQNGRKVVL